VVGSYEHKRGFHFTYGRLKDLQSATQGSVWPFSVIRLVSTSFKLEPITRLDNIEYKKVAV